MTQERFDKICKDIASSKETDATRDELLIGLTLFINERKNSGSRLVSAIDDFFDLRREPPMHCIPH